VATTLNSDDYLLSTFLASVSILRLELAHFEKRGSFMGRSNLSHLTVGDQWAELPSADHGKTSSVSIESRPLFCGHAENYGEGINATVDAGCVPKLSNSARKIEWIDDHG
jgi:hypothetical protein